MFNIEELKSLSEMQSQAVHCLWHRKIKKQTFRTWNRGTRSKNI